MPTSHGQQLLSELWALQMYHFGTWQLAQLPRHVDGMPPSFSTHPFCFIDAKEQGGIHNQPVGHSPDKASLPGLHFFMDFGFMRAPTMDYKFPQPGSDGVVECFEGCNAYLIIVDEASCYVWVFLHQSKIPPVDLIMDFLSIHGNTSGGVIHTDLGGELARSTAL
jgi:hypothetical protein